MASRCSTFATPDLGYVLELERPEGRITGRDDPVVSALRATLVLRREAGTWKIAHRHAHPITADRPPGMLVGVVCQPNGGRVSLIRQRPVDSNPAGRAPT